MIRGMLGGVLWGAVLAALALAVVSQVAPPPTGRALVPAAGDVPVAVAVAQQEAAAQAAEAAAVATAAESDDRAASDVAAPEAERAAATEADSAAEADPVTADGSAPSLANGPPPAAPIPPTGDATASQAAAGEAAPGASGDPTSIAAATAEGARLPPEAATADDGRTVEGAAAAEPVAEPPAPSVVASAASAAPAPEPASDQVQGSEAAASGGAEQGEAVAGAAPADDVGASDGAVAVDAGIATPSGAGSGPDAQTAAEAGGPTPAGTGTADASGATVAATLPAALQEEPPVSPPAAKPPEVVADAPAPPFAPQTAAPSAPELAAVAPPPALAAAPLPPEAPRADAAPDLVAGVPARAPVFPTDPPGALAETSLPQTAEPAIPAEAPQPIRAAPPETRLAEAPLADAAAPDSAAPAPAPLPEVTAAAEGAPVRPARLAPDGGLVPDSPPPRAGRLPRIIGPAARSDPDAAAAADPIPAAAEGDGTDTRPAIERFARAFENPAGKPVFAIVLVDSGEPSLDRRALAALPFPVTFLLDPSRPDAALAASIYREGGQEVAMLATGLPKGAKASDLEVTFAAYGEALPEAVAIVDPAEGGFQGDRDIATMVAPIAKGQGRGLLSWDRGLNAAEQVARRQGLRSGVIYRQMDGGGEDAGTMRRILDRAAFKAAQEGRVIVAGGTKPDTVAALLAWAVEGRATTVALAPLSAALVVQ